MNKPLGILIVVLITLSSLVGCFPTEFEVSTSREETIPAEVSEPASAPNTTSNVVQEKVEDMGGSFTEDLMVIRRQAERLGIKMQSVAHAGSSITIIWQADSYTNFRDYLTALEESGRFTTPIPSPPEGYPNVKGGSITLEPKFQMDISDVYYKGNQALAPMPDSAAIAMLVSIAEKSGIDITPEASEFRVPAATFSAVKVGGDTYKIMSFKNIQVQGNYDNVIAFISDLDSGATMETMVLTRVTISEIDGKIETRATVDVDIYTKSY